MRAYLLGRLISGVPVLLGVSIVIFLLMKLIPGDAAQVLAQVEGFLALIARAQPLRAVKQNWVTAK